MVGKGKASTLEGPTCPATINDQVGATEKRGERGRERPFEQTVQSSGEAIGWTEKARLRQVALN